MIGCSRRHFGGVVVPEAERIATGIALGSCGELVMRCRKISLIGSCPDRNRWACRCDLNRPSTLSRFRVDLCDPSIARYSRCILPWIATTTSSRCYLSLARGRSYRVHLAKWRPTRMTHNRTASRLTVTPSPTSISSTSAALSAKRWNTQTSPEMPPQSLVF